MLKPETLDRMVTERRAEIIARELFAADYHAGGDCRAEIGREGLPCGICLSQRAAWLERVATVRAAVQKGFR